MQHVARQRFHPSPESFSRRRSGAGAGALKSFLSKFPTEQSSDSRNRLRRRFPSSPSPSPTSKAARKWKRGELESEGDRTRRSGPPSPTDGASKLLARSRLFSARARPRSPRKPSLSRSLPFLLCVISPCSNFPSF